jgi:hypothetical protein
VTEREFGNFSAWSLKELIEKERSFTAGDRRRAELRAEIDRRIAAQNKRITSANFITTIITAFAAVVSVVYALDRGIYVGSTTNIATINWQVSGGKGAVHKICRYLFITGITELPALGGLEAMPGYAFAEPMPPWPTGSSLHCRFFAE